MPNDQPPRPRSPGPSWDELAARDINPPPAFLRGEQDNYLGSAPIPVQRYTGADFFRAETEKMWPRVWQFAAREEELPNPGDTVVYENVGRSFLITRQQDGSIRAFYNACLHRGRKLRSESGPAQNFRCNYHAFTWDIDGSLKFMPCRWDFPHLTEAGMRLPQATVGRWGGYIFVREAAEGPSIEEYLAPLPEHFRAWPHDDCYTAVWAAKRVAANWKATAEAFMEAFHVIATHPQLMTYVGDCNTKYFTWGDHVNLALTPFGVRSPHLGAGAVDEQQLINDFLKYNGRVAAGLGQLTVPQGSTARQLMGEVNRARFGAQAGIDASGLSDSEVQDAYTYNVFPNFAPWGGFMPNVVYRWRPWPDQDHTLMEVRLLLRAPKDQPKPPCAKMRLLGEHETWSNVTEFSALGNVLDQDWANLPHVQTGMKALKSGELQLANYQEIRVRHFHRTLDRYLAGA